MKFKFGDRIAANDRSDSYYGVTCKSNGWTGYVVGIVGERTIRVCVDREGKNNVFTVSASCFDLIEDEEPLPAPDAEIFDALFG